MDGKASAVLGGGGRGGGGGLEGSFIRPFRHHRKISALPSLGIKLPEKVFLKKISSYSAEELNDGSPRVVSLSFIKRRTPSRQHVEMAEENVLERARKVPARPRTVKMQAMQPFTSARPRKNLEQEEFPPRRTQRNCVPHSRDIPPKRDTGIASEKDWGINLLNEMVNESGTNEDGSTWYRESGEDIGENGYRCRWALMGGRSGDGSSEWREAWWEKSDWTGYKELGVEKSGRNAQGDTWWETWQEVLRQDDWSNLARIERSAQKQAKSGSGAAGWYEKWWEKYNAKGWTEKGAHKYGRLNEQSWWEKWGEQYDGSGSVRKWTDKWAETDLGTKWGDKWEEKFFSGMGTRQGETWHATSDGDRKSMIILQTQKMLLQVGQGRGEKNTLEMERCINMAGAQLVKVGILWWRKAPIMRRSPIMDGQMLSGTLHNCYQSNHENDLQAFTQILILDHPLHHKHHQNRHHPHQNKSSTIICLPFPILEIFIVEH